MKKNQSLNGEAKEASLKELLAAELFLNENYQFRRNVLNGKVEYVTKSKADEVIADSDPAWQPLTQEDLNSIILRAKREDICDGGNPKADIELFLHSKEVRTYDPINEYLTHLPKWDGQNHVAQLFKRLPGLDSELMNFLVIWQRSTVAHWMQMDTLVGLLKLEPMMINCNLVVT